MDNSSVEAESLTARVKCFEDHLVVNLGMARATGRMRANIVRTWLRTWGTLAPTKDLVLSAREQCVLKGYHRGYVSTICLALRDYGEFARLDLAVPRPNSQRARVPRFLTQQEVQAFLSVVGSVRDRALFSLLAYSGLRCRELVHLRREDVNFEKQTVVVQSATAKGGSGGEVPIARAALNALDEYLRCGERKDESPWLFQRPDGGKLSTNRVRVLAARYGSKAGICKRVSPHMFRHALATNLLAGGCPLPVVQRQLRHANIETTMVYLHLSDAMLHENYVRFAPSY